MKLTHVRIVGTGLIGTSIGLALAKRGISVDVDDANEKNAKLARDLIGTNASHAIPELVIVATPPQSVFAQLKEEFEANPQATFIDVSSVKTELIRNVEGLSELAERFVGTHPMAGREIGGAQSAQGDLFEGRAWIITKSSVSDYDAVVMVREFITLLGATPYEMDAYSHDALMARISHLPQVMSTALAGAVAGSADLELAGQGLRDMTRLAASDAALWSEILFANKNEVQKILSTLKERLSQIDSAIQSHDRESLEKFFSKGREGRAQLSGKHGAKPRNYALLRIVIEDKPGQLSRLFIDCAEVNANIEDLAIEHSPGQFTGLITLAFSSEDADRVAKHLMAKSWKVHRE